MSFHLIEEAARCSLRPSHKLVLLALANSAPQSDPERKAYPGEENLRQWSGLSRTRLYEVLTDLEKFKLIQRVTRGHNGRRSTFVVFPLGCCERHGKVPFSTGYGDADDLGEGSATQDATDDPEPCGQSDGPDPTADVASAFCDVASAFSVVASAPERTPSLPTTTEISPVVADIDHSLAADPPDRENVVGFTHWKDRRAS